MLYILLLRLILEQRILARMEWRQCIDKIFAIGEAKMESVKHLGDLLFSEGECGLK